MGIIFSQLFVYSCIFRKSFKSASDAIGAFLRARHSERSEESRYKAKVPPCIEIPKSRKAGQDIIAEKYRAGEIFWLLFTISMNRLHISPLSSARNDRAASGI